MSGNTGAYGIAKQTDGKYVVVGVGGGFTTEVVRYLPDGQPDSSFGTGGVVSLSPPTGAFQGHAVAIDSSGGIVVAGNRSMNTGDEFGVMRLLASSGAVDTSFGTSGWSHTALGDGVPVSADSVVVDSTSGQIIVGGEAEDGGIQKFALAAYDSHGAAVSGFGSAGTGTVLTDVAHGDAQINALALDGSKIVAAGWAVDPLDGNRYEAAVMGHNSDGSADSSFDSGFPAAVPMGGSTVSGAGSVLVQSSHRIVIGGWAHTGSGGKQFALRRLTEAGQTDITFGSGGETLTTVGSIAAIESLGQNGEGLYAGGWTSDGSGNDQFALARYSADGVLDPAGAPSPPPRSPAIPPPPRRCCSTARRRCWPAPLTRDSRTPSSRSSFSWEAQPLPSSRPTPRRRP